MRNDLLRLALAGLLGIATTSAAAPAWAQGDDDDDDGGAMMDDDDDGGGGTMDDDDDKGGGDTGDNGGGDTTAGGTAGGKGMIGEKGDITIAGGVLINFSSDAVFKPLSINPDVWYVVGPKLEVGLAHSPQALTGFYAGSGGGLCITGDTNGCPDVYGNPSLIAHYGLMDGKLSMVADGGLIFVSLSDATVAIKVGVKGRYVVNDKMVVWFAPNLWIGVTDRTIDLGMGMGSINVNTERLHLPVAFGYKAADKVMVGVQTGIAAFLDGFGDNWRGELGFGGFYDVDDKLQVGLVFAFDNLYGNGGGGDARSLQLTGSYSL